MHKYLVLTAATVAAAMLAGCSAKDTSPSGAQAAKFTLDTPKPTGDLDTLKWGVPGSEPASLDWIYDWDYGPSNLIQSNLCEGLTRQNPDGSSTPALASDVKAPNDTTYVYQLRAGVTFTDGKPVTAEDVAFSLNRNLTANPPSYWALWYTNVGSIKATSPTEVTVTLKQPDALFNSVMSTPAGYVGEKAYIEKAGSAYGTPAGGVMCTGPFSLKTWAKGQSVTLQRNDNYWDPTLKAKSRQVVFSFIPDAAAMTSALMTGEIDGAVSMDVSTLKTLRKAGSGKLYLNEGTEVVVMQFNDLSKGPLSDPRIRQALRYAVDYDGIVAGILDGYGTPAKSLTPPSTFGYAKDVWQAGYDSLTGGKQDLQKAKDLVTAAGAPSQPIVIAVSSDDQSQVNAVTSIQDSARTIGLTITVKKYPANEFTNLFYDEKARQQVNVMVNPVTVDTPDPLELLMQVMPGSPFNYTKIDDKDLTAELSEARRTADPAKRAQLGTDAAKIINDKVYSLPLYSTNARMFLGTNVTGAPVSTLSQWYYPWAATVGKP